MVKEYLDTKVTKIGNRYHIRLINTETNKVLDEIACDTRSNIGYCCYYVLRWHAKCGGSSPMALATRNRQKYVMYQSGKIWYPAQVLAFKKKLK